MCAAVKNGATEKDIVARFRVTCKAEKPEKTELEAAAEAAISQLNANSAEIDNTLLILVIVNVLAGLLFTFLSLVAVSRLLRLVPGLQRAAQALSAERVASVIVQLRRARAANDSIVNVLRGALARAA